MFPLLMSLLLSLLLMIISLALVYWVIKSAINDSDLISLLRSIDHKLSTMQTGEEHFQTERARAYPVDKKSEHDHTAKELVVDGILCPACATMIPRYSKICPSCGIVLLDEEK